MQSQHAAANAFNQRPARLAGVIRERYPGLPVVLTSGYSNVLAENAHRGFELIQKPYSVESLSRILRKAISDARL